MDFARSFMQKHGWKEGEGLGKNNDGIEKPLKANYKFDNAGLGLDRAADFNNHWWERVYNDAANNLEVKNDDDVSVGIKNNDGLEISTKEYSVKKLQKLTGTESYNNFLKSTTLSSSGELADPNRIEANEIGLAKYKQLTDEALFAACGGRTAHKGARHGLKLSGKLARIEQQEKELLKKINSDTTFEINSPDWEVVIGKKPKRKRRTEEKEEPNEIEDLLDTTEYTTKSKKKRKEKNRLENDLSSCLDGFSLSEFRKDDNGDVVLDPGLSSVNERDESQRKVKKKKRKNKKAIDSNAAGNGEVREEFDDQLTVNSLEVNISDSSSSYRSLVKLKHKSKKVKKKEKKLMKKLTNSLESSVVITD